MSIGNKHFNNNLIVL